jgi:hypothetical protein
MTDGEWIHFVFSCSSPPPPPNKQELFLLGQRQRGGARHSGAPMLRRYAATSTLFWPIANLSAV